MIKMIIFDLDGVLIKSKDMHFEALNFALQNVDRKYIISPEEHKTKFNGLPTLKKLEILTEERGLDSNLYSQINKLKQELTLNFINNQVVEVPEITEAFQKLSSEGYLLVVASNAVRKTVEGAIRNLKIGKYLAGYYCNEDVTRPKPSAQMYLRAMVDFNIDPIETVILEDSRVGFEAVARSGANLIRIKEVKDTNYENIKEHLIGIHAKLYLNHQIVYK